MQTNSIWSSDKCVHFWRIAEPDGPTSTGICIYCGDIRPFLNSIDIITRNRWNQRHIFDDAKPSEDLTSDIDMPTSDVDTPVDEPEYSG